MSLLPSIFKSIGNGLLKKPGDSIFAKITPTGNQVIKISTETIKRTAIRYPSTGTIVETIVHHK